MSSGLIDEAAPQLRLGILHHHRVVFAESVQGGSAIGTACFRRHPIHREPPPTSAAVASRRISR